MGYRYNATFNVESAGTITTVNSLAAHQKARLHDKRYTLDDLRTAIRENFGFKTAHEVIPSPLSTRKSGRRRSEMGKDALQCLQAPKYGNDDKLRRQHLLEWENFFCRTATT